MNRYEKEKTKNKKSYKVLKLRDVTNKVKITIQINDFLG
jgi:hypothetical protein